MSLKKFLKTSKPTNVIARSDSDEAILFRLLRPFGARNDSRAGQASLEFFILFAVVSVMTIVSISSFFSTMQTNTEGLFRKAVGVNGINIGNK